MKTIHLVLAGLFALVVTAGGGTANDPQKPQQDRLDAKKRQAVRPGEVNTPPAKGERHADQLKVGDPAPDFTLPDPAGKEQTTLSSFRGRKPVVLIFGSFT